ncbi:hypothetical protein DSO57_1009869 [Entomophthora muscae]|uniref:Uncharacterized protein n=1 Tax=Entomophthora muscae TaxID=34485 RepID=A0ACC2SJG8_9FUNG|nr:hypothetical protein DSO57_1009869 [Entomophthora muscae]
MSMYEANNQDKATTLLNQIDAASTDLIIPHMLQNDWSYAAAKQVLGYKFGSIARVTEQKNEFLMIQFQKDKSIAEFEDQFYLEVQILTGSGSLTVHDTHIALRSAVKPYEVLYCTLMPVFQDNCSIDGMVQYLHQCRDTFGPPMTWSSLDLYPLFLSVQKGVGALLLRPTCPRLLTIAVIVRGTTQIPALLKQAFTYCHLKTFPSREKPKWSRDRTLSLHYKQPHQCPYCPA